MTRDKGGIAMSGKELHCPSCGGMVYENDEYCLECGTELKGRFGERRRRAAQPKETEAEVRSDSGPATQQVTTVEVRQETPWWILALIFGLPVGCAALPILLLFGLVVGTYFAPLVIAAGVALWIWYKHPGKRQERMRLVWITLGIGLALTILLWVGVFVVNYGMASSAGASAGP